MKKSVLSLLLISAFLISAYGQKKVRPYRCGLVTKDLEANYNSFWKHVNVKKGERIASVGCCNGYIEAQIAAFNDSIEWTLQEIDTACLNKTNWSKVLMHHEKLKGKSIVGTFTLLKGDESKTNLTQNYYDRILLFNVYHELSSQESILVDIKGALNNKGQLVIMERMARKKNAKRKDCGHVMPWEPDFYSQMIQLGFSIVQKDIAYEESLLTFYTFEKNTK